MTTGNNNDLVFEIPARLQEHVTFLEMQKQLEEISKKLSITINNVNFDTRSFNELKKQIQQVQEQVSKISDAKITPQIDTKQLTTATRDGMAVVQKYLNQIKDQFNITDDAIKTSFSLNTITGQIEAFTATITKAQGEVQKLKYLSQSAVGGTTQTFKLAPFSQLNDSSSPQLLKEWTQAAEQYFAGVRTEADKTNQQIDKDAQKMSQSISKVDQSVYKLYESLQMLNVNGREGLQNSLLGKLGTGDTQGLSNLQQQIASIKEMSALQTQALAQNEAYDTQQARLAEKTARQDEQAYADAIAQKTKLLKTFNDLEITSNEDYFNELKQLYEQNATYFANNINANISMLSKLNDAEKKSETVRSGSNASSNGRNLSNSHMQLSGFGMTPLNMGITLAQLQLEASLIENIKNGFVTLQKGSAGLHQVFGASIQNQTQLNAVTNQFVAIAQKYGESVDEVVTSAKLWGRQYKDLNTALTLTNNATLLSAVDNLSVADANKAVESSMNAMGETVTNAGQAYSDSIKLVDSWSAVSHQASVSARDLTGGFERSAAAAHNAGVTIDQLNSLVAAGVRNTGRSGNVIGNMLKSVFANIESGKTKVQEAFKALGIQMYDAKGNLEPVYNMLIQLSEKLKTSTPDIQKYFEAIAGGKYQFDTLEATLSNTTTLTNTLAESEASQGKAAELVTSQLGTLHAQLTRLQNAIQDLAFNASNSNGVGSALSSMIGGLTDFLQGLAALPKQVTMAGVALTAFLLLGNRFKSLTGSMSGLTNWFQKFRDGWNGAEESTNSETAALAENSNALDKVNATITSYIEKQNAAKMAVESDTVAINAETKALEAQAVARKELLLANSSGTVGGITKGAIGSTVANEATVAESAVVERSLMTKASGALGAGLTAGAILSPETLGLSLGIPAAIAAVTTLIGVYGKWHETQLQDMQATNQVTDTYNKNAKQIDALAQQYSKLSGQTKDGTVFKSTHQQQQYYNVMTQLSKLLPNVTASVDKNGQVHLDNAKFVNKEVEALKALNDEQASSVKNDKSGNPIDSFVSQLVKAKGTMETAQQAGSYTVQTNASDMNLDLPAETKKVTESVQKQSEELIKAAQDINKYKAVLAQMGSTIQSVSKTLMQSNGVKLSSGNQNLFSFLTGSITSSSFSKNTDELKKQITNVSEIYAQFMQKVQSSTNKDGIVSMQGWQKAVKQAESQLSKWPDLSNMFKQSLSGMDVFSQNLGVLTQKYDTQRKSIQDLATGMGNVNEVINEYNNNQSVSASLINKTIKGNSQLSQYFTEIDGKYQINIQGLKDYRTAQIDQTNSAISGIEAQVKAQQEALNAKLKMYGLEINGLQDVAEAQNKLANPATVNGKQAIDANGNPVTLSNYLSSTGKGNVINQVSDASGFAQLLSSLQTLEKQSPSQITSTGALAAPKSSASTGSSSPYTTYMDQNQNPNSTQLNILDTQLQTSQTVMGEYATTSQQYRNELQKQVNLIQEKNKYTKDDITWTQQQIDQLEELKSKTSNLNTQKSIQSQIDTYKENIATDQGNLATNNANIKTAQDNYAGSQLQVFFNQIANSTVDTTNKITDLNNQITNLGSNPDLNQTVTLQTQLLGTYQSQLKTVNNNVSQLTIENNSLAQTLGVNSQSWQSNNTELQNQISAQATLRQNIIQTQQALSENKLQVFFTDLATNATNASNTINTLNQQISFLGTSSSDQQKSISLTNQLITAYQQYTTVLQNNNAALDAEASKLPRNSQQYKEIQTQIQNNTSAIQANEQALATAVQNEQSAIVAKLQSLEQQAQTNLTNMQTAMTNTLNNMAKRPTDYGLETWNQSFDTIKENLNEIDGAFNTVPLFNDTTGNVRSTLQVYNEQLTQLVSTARQLGEQNPQDVNGLYSNIEKEITFSNSLQKTISSVNEQEATLQLRITETTNNYQNQISALQEQLSLLQQQYSTQSNLTQLQKTQLQLQQAMQEKNSQYVNSSGKVVWTYNASTVSQLKQSQDQLVQQIQQSDVTNALQTQISNLQNEQSKQTQILNDQLSSLQNYSKGLTSILTGVNSDVQSKESQLSTLFSNESRTITNNFQTMENAVTNMSGSLSNTLNGPQGIMATLMGFGTGINTFSSGMSGVVSQVQSMTINLNNALSALQQAQQLLLFTEETGAKSSMSTAPTSTNYIPPNINIGGKTYETQNTGGVPSIRLHHDGGIVGEGPNVTPSGVSSLVNKLFNVRPNEQVIKALVGEVMVPPSNIIRNFVPNMQNLMGRLSGVSGTLNNKNYSIGNVNITTNDPMQLFNGIEYLTQSM